MKSVNGILFILFLFAFCQASEFDASFTIQPWQVSDEFLFDYELTGEVPSATGIYPASASLQNATYVFEVDVPTPAPTYSDKDPMFYVNDTLMDSSEFHWRGQGAMDVSRNGVYVDFNVPTPKPNPTLPAVDALSNVNTTGKDAGDVLYWNGVVWGATPQGMGTGGGATVLDQLYDVDLNSESSGEFLIFDGASWVNGTPQPTAWPTPYTPVPTVTEKPYPTVISFGDEPNTNFVGANVGDVPYLTAGGVWETTPQASGGSGGGGEGTSYFRDDLDTSFNATIENNAFAVYQTSDNKWHDQTPVPTVWPTPRNIKVDGDELAGDANFLVEGHGNISQNMGTVTIRIWTPKPTATAINTPTSFPSPNPTPTLVAYWGYRNDGAQGWVTPIPTPAALGDNDDLTTSGGVDEAGNTIEMLSGSDLDFDGTLGEIRADNQLQIILDDDNDDGDWGFDFREEDGTYDYIHLQIIPDGIHSYKPFRVYRVNAGGSRGWLSSLNMSTNTKLFEVTNTHTIFYDTSGNEIARANGNDRTFVIDKNLYIPVGTPTIEPPDSNHVALYWWLDGGSKELRVRDSNGDDYNADGTSR